MRVALSGDNVTLQLNWHVIRTVPIFRVEFHVMHALNQLERPALVPFEEKKVQHPRTKKIETRKFPFFPCYVVAGFHGIHDFLAVKAVINEQFERRGKRAPIVNLVGYSSTKPATLTTEELDLIREFSIEKPTEVRLTKGFKEGEDIRVLDGSFAGHTMKFKRLKKDRLVAMGMMFGTLMEIELPRTTAVDAA